MTVGFSNCCCDPDVGTSGATCTNCTSPVATEYDIDFGAGGWTNANCNNCPAMQGIVTVSGGGNLAPDGCIWLYSSCPSAWCNWGGADWFLNVALTIYRDDGEVRVKISLNTVCDTGAYVGIYDFSDTPPINCNGPFTLTKTFDSLANGQNCSGAGPATITVSTA